MAGEKEGSKQRGREWTVGLRAKKQWRVLVGKELENGKGFGNGFTAGLPVTALQGS